MATEKWREKMETRRTAFFQVVVCGLTWLAASATAWAAAPPSFCEKPDKLMSAGNYKDALDLYQALALDPATKPWDAAHSLERAVSCLQSLGRANEMDVLREKAIQAHNDHWQVLKAAAVSYFNGEHYGTLIGGKFERGPQRGGGKYANSFERDRVRALQLMDKALAKADERYRQTRGDPADRLSASEMGGFCVEYAEMLMGDRGTGESWRLQYLTDLGQLPDVEEGYWYGRQGTRGAPVDEHGEPVFYKIPKTLADAKNDGERWRWLLTQEAEYDSSRLGDSRLRLAEFLKQQFGVQTMADQAWGFRPRREDDEKAESGTYALNTLAENETIARLATGLKRFTLPAEFDFIRIYKQVADDTKSGFAEGALNALAEIFENRRQYPRAEEYWKRSIRQFSPGSLQWKQKRLDQIAQNWGRFEPELIHPAGQEVSVQYRFRNATQVTFEAREIKVKELLDDVKEYLKSNPKELEWDRMQVDNIGYRLVEKKRDKFVGKEAARWDLRLEPKADHVDRLVTVKTPLKKAGAYLLTATLANGNVSKIIVWIDDTAIVRKQLDGKAFFYVADAVSGTPLPKVNLEFFGYRQDYVTWQKAIGRHYNILTSQFVEYTDADGQFMPAPTEMKPEYQWLITATTEDGRLAYLGFSGVWYGHQYDAEYNQRKVFGITDRPVYRPNQPVKFKFWIRQAQYDQDNSSPFANQEFAVIVTNPKGDKVFEKTYRTDAYAGLDGEFALPKDAALGQYYGYVWQGGTSWGGVRFRVEEYKKPEFEVNIEAPTEPVALGEKITATVKAKYYFGAPVKKAKVKIKVMRSDYSANWYPCMPWDWFYGPGYWWFACDYLWYPGWREWGCRAPHGWWWPATTQPPELVADVEMPIGEDGTVKVPIDTKPAAELHGDSDHQYTITAEVTDESRRTIVGQGTVMVARKPFKVYAWVDRGHYRPGDVVRADFAALTLANKPVEGKGELKLFSLRYKDGEPVEKVVEEWDLNTDADGRATQQIKASKAGQYRLSYAVKDAKKHTVEGGYVFVVRGEGDDGKAFRFNEIELTPDKREYAPGEKVRLLVNTDHAGGTVLLFVRPSNGIYLPPRVLRLKGKSVEQEIEVAKKDMPNFFVEAVTVFGGKVYSQTREIVVPPEKRVLNVEVLPSALTYKPGETAKVKVKLTDFFDKPFVGSTVLSVYDKSVEYISGGSNIEEIKAFFWKWRRHHSPSTLSSLDRSFYNLTLPGAISMSNLGVFGETVVDEISDGRTVNKPQSGKRLRMGVGGGVARKMAVVSERSEMEFGAAPAEAAPMAAFAAGGDMAKANADSDGISDKSAVEQESVVQPTVRKDFADTAYWNASLATDSNGLAEVAFKMPENLTGWKVRSWAMGQGTKVGEASVEVVTTKNLLLRLQAPRFFVEKDEVVLSANIHNYLRTAKTARVVLELEGGCLESLGGKVSDHSRPTETQETALPVGREWLSTRNLPAASGQNENGLRVKIEAGGEERVDWRVKVVKEGQAVVRMKALTDEESDAMETRFPVYVHGMLKTDSFCGVIRPDKDSASVMIEVPAERRMDQSRLELRYSPTLAGALVDALPYLVDYPYGCTEQTLNRFLPTVIVQKTLKDMGLDLKAIRAKQTNLNAQEIGDDRKRAEDWKRLAGERTWKGEAWVERNPVFDESVVDDMVKQGLKALTAMQLDDGGWGWFSGWGEQSWPHTTAYVVHGLQIAKASGVAVVPGVMDRGVAWLARYQAEQLQELKNEATRARPWKEHADDLDAFVYMVLADADKDSAGMRDFLYRDRTGLSVYAKAMFGLALHKTGQTEKLDMILQNIEQYLVRDAENQTAYLKLGNEGCWWYWYGSENEAHAYYLKLLALTAPKSDKASELVKYLLNNRRHATYWNSTRDTALCIEAMSDYLRASGEDKPDMTVEIFVDGRRHKTAKITADNLFSFDNKLVLEGDAVESGRHKVEVRRSGHGPVYFNAYLTNFTLENYIRKAGLEIKVDRKFYKLTPAGKTVKVAGARGQALDQKVEKYDREELADLAALKSGDLVEVELLIQSKNDYEYIVFEDMKAAGFEPVDVRSGYTGNEMGAYVEFRDERVCFFVRALARGTHSLSYRLRAEIPGRFSALPTRASAMYAPELKANSDEIKLRIED